MPEIILIFTDTAEPLKSVIPAMQISPTNKNEKTELHYLPDFAGYLLHYYLDDFLKVSYELLRSNDVPLLRLLDFNEGEALSNKSGLELLTSLINNNPSEHVQKAIERWRTSQLPRVATNMIVVEDVTLIAYSRKLAFLKFIPGYTSDPIKIVELVKEIEKYILEYTTTTFITFVGIIDERISQHVESLEQRTRELQDSNASLEEFAYVASHDLKEPLRKISVFMDRLAPAKEKLTEKENKLFDKIMNSALRMGNMIDDLLLLSLLSEQKRAEKTSLQTIFDEVIVELEHRIDEVNADIHCDHLPEVFVVPSQFRQLFQNLLSNALKFVKPGVVPEINISHRFTFQNELGHQQLKSAARYLEIRITDNGIGFDSKFAEKIFSVFQRLHQKHEYEGTGIGLSICRKIVKNHGGVITASGRVNEGAAFVIIIPC